MPGKDRVSEVTKMSLYVVANIVGYIRGMEDMPYDAVDIEESFDEVLAHYDLHPELSDEERDVLKDALLRVVLRIELDKMKEMLDMGLKSGLDRVGLKLYPWLFQKRRQGQGQKRKREYSVGGSSRYEVI